MKVIFLIIFLLIYSSAYSKTKDNLKICLSLYKIAASAIDYKNKGKTKEEMLAPLPSKTQIEKSDQLDPRVLLASSMHDIIDEVYNYEALPISVYAPYSSEKCIRKGNNLPIEPFSITHPKLKECAKLKTSEAHLDCAFKVINDNT